MPNIRSQAGLFPGRAGVGAGQGKEGKVGGWRLDKDKDTDMGMGMGTGMGKDGPTGSRISDWLKMFEMSHSSLERMEGSTASERGDWCIGGWLANMGWARLGWASRHT